MKKRKTNEETGPADFKNSPFKSLKGFAPRFGSTNERSRTQESSRREVTQEDDQTLFLNAVEGTTRIGKIRKYVSPIDRQHDKKGNRERDEDKLFLAAMQNIGTTIKTGACEPEEEENGNRSTANRMRLLKRGTIRINQELDLHGFLRDEALQLLHSFILQAYNQGLKAVLVITGKGINSPEGPVLQGAVDAWLRKEGRGMVAEFSTAPRERGGKGAFVVFLKKK